MTRYLITQRVLRTYGTCDLCGETQRGADPGISELNDGRKVCVWCFYWNVPVGPERQRMREQRMAEALQVLVHNPYEEKLLAHCTSWEPRQAALRFFFGTSLVLPKDVIIYELET